jgi:type IV secretory pathway VirD2 relaxase
MSDDDEFTPKLGKPKSRGSGRKARKYLGAVIGAAARAGIQTGKRRARFDGSRIGRGASIGRILASRDRLAGFRGRRAVVKMSYTKLAGGGLPAARVHLNYLQRGGVSRDGGPGQLYSAGEDVADRRAFLDRSAGDERQFRFIVSAEDGDQYRDLKPFIRKLMTQVEQDLGTKLDWVAVDHYDTGHPHTHIVLRGVDERGQNLLIGREYVSAGMRQRAMDLLDIDLGPRTTLEIEERLRHDIGAERMTAIDRRMLRDMEADRIVATAMRDPFQQSLRVGRLRKLEELGLAERTGGAHWQLVDRLENRLREIGQRGDIIRTMQREISARGRAGAEHAIYDAASAESAQIIGRVIGRGLADDLYDRHYLLVDAIDGRTHYVDLGRGDAVGPMPVGEIVRVAPARGEVRAVDRTVAEIAAANNGHYSIDLHLRHDPSATEKFAEAHVRRLEAIRRMTSGADRRPDGTWEIAPDHLARVETYEARIARDRPVTVETVSPVPLESLAREEALTFLDRRLAGEDQAPARDTGFGRELRQAEAQRRQWLMAEGLAEEQDGTVRLRANALAVLQRRELLRVTGELSDELGRPVVVATSGERIAGTLLRRVDMTSGRFALVERSRDFTLVPWRPVLERHLGKAVSGIMRESGMSWTFGRQRSGPNIS